jgi:hypothetical protein
VRCIVCCLNAVATAPGSVFVSDHYDGLSIRAVHYDGLSIRAVHRLLLECGRYRSRFCNGADCVPSMDDLGQ